MTKAAVLRQHLKTGAFDGALVTGSHAVFFFTGFKSSNALWLVSKSREVLLTDGRYLEAARRHFAGSSVEVEPIPMAAGWQTLLAGLGIRKLGVNFEQLTVSEFHRFRRNFGVELKDFADFENSSRVHKTTAEIEGVAAACRLADQALAATLPFLKTGVSETEFAWLLEKTGRELGAEAVSFEPIVAFGQNSAAPHHHAGDKPLKPGLAVLIDWGFLVNGFASDCTRSFYFGAAPDDWLATYQKVLAAQAAGIAAMRAGNPVAAPQLAAEAVLAEKIPHGFGHGIGVEVHEYPHASPRGSGKFVDGSTVTAEPGLYYEGRFGIRIEDVVAVSTGEPRVLTGFPKAVEGAILKA